MKMLLIGPYPPPHGGISVHVSGIHRQLIAAGAPCAVLNTSRIRSRFRFAMELARYAARGWTLHLHTNGHNRNSWLLALLCGIAGQGSGGCILTLHSGMMPGYVRTSPSWRRALAGFVCRLYSRVILVSPELRDAAISLGTPAERTEIAPARLATGNPHVSLDPQLIAWIKRHHPLLSTTLFFRPEYGFDLLIEGFAQLRRRHTALGCIVMGSGEQYAEAVKRVRECGLESDVLLLGDLDHDRCLALISRSHVFVRPTLKDGDSISVREALVLGVPVVASRVGSRPPGTILFHPGNVEDMLSKIELTLGSQQVLLSEEACAST
ncbi:MAG: glycosyltransferase family 4 protein [Bryobacteraceae bacterium]